MKKACSKALYWKGILDNISSLALRYPSCLSSEIWLCFLKGQQKYKRIPAHRTHAPLALPVQSQGSIQGILTPVWEQGPLNILRAYNKKMQAVKLYYNFITVNSKLLFTCNYWKEELAVSHKKGETWYHHAIASICSGTEGDLFMIFQIKMIFVYPKQRLLNCAAHSSGTSCWVPEPQDTTQKVTSFWTLNPNEQKKYLFLEIRYSSFQKVTQWDLQQRKKNKSISVILQLSILCINLRLLLLRLSNCFKRKTEWIKYILFLQNQFLLSLTAGLIQNKSNEVNGFLIV